MISLQPANEPRKPAPTIVAQERPAGDTWAGARQMGAERYILVSEENAAAEAVDVVERDVAIEDAW